MGSNTFKIVTGIVFPPLGVYYGLRAAGLSAQWAGFMLAGPLGFSAMPSIEQYMAGKPGMPSFGGGELNSSATYGFQGIQNTTRVGTPIGVVYGTHRVGGQLLSVNIATQNDDTDRIQMLIGQSEGPIKSISSVQINGQPSGNYRGISIQTRTGESDQAPITLFGDSSSTSFSNDVTLSQEYVIYTTNGTNLTAFAVKFVMPGGLYAMDKNTGDFVQHSVDVQIDYKLHTDSTWTVGPRPTFRAATRSTLRKLVRVDGLAPGQYDIRVRRMSPQSSSSSSNDEIHRELVNEIVNDKYAYPCVALLAVDALATEQLSGGIPTVSAIVDGRIIRAFSNASTYAWVFTNNPAWVVFDILTNPRYGMGNFVWQTLTTEGTISLTGGSAVAVGSGTNWAETLNKGDKIVLDSIGRVVTVDSVVDDNHFVATAAWDGGTLTGLAYEAHRNDLDIQSFIDWAAYCDELVPDGNGGTEKRATCDLVLDADAGLWDTVVRVCGLGHANPVKSGNYIRIHIERATAATQLFAMSNIVKGTFRETFVPLKDRANLFEAQFLNAANDYQHDTIQLEDPLITTNSEPIRKRTVSFYGAVRSTHVLRLTRRMQKSNRYVSRMIQFGVGLDAVNCEPGDVINFQHDVPQWGFSSRIGTGSTTSTLVLDKAMTIESGKSYEVLVRFADDTLESRSVTNTPGTYTILTVSGAFSQVPADGDLAAFGEVGIATKPFRVIGIQRAQDLTATITAIEYNANVYDDSAVLGVGSAPQYSVLPDLVGPPPQVTDLSLTQLANGSVWVTFNPPADYRYVTAYIYRTESGTNVKAGESGNGSFILNGIQPGTTIRIAVVSVGSNQVQADFNQAPVATLTVGAGSKPPIVTGLELDGQGNVTTFIGKDAKFRWRGRSRISGAGLSGLGMEASGFGSGFQDPLFKCYRVEIYNADGVTLRRRENVLDAAYVYTYEKNYQDGVAFGEEAVRSFVIRVWQQDRSNQLSEAPAILSVTNVAPGLLSNVVAVAMGDSVRVKWDASREPDVTGYRVHSSVEQGFTPDDSNVVYDGPSNLFDLPDAQVGTYYYFRVAAYDSFGREGLTYSGEVSAIGSGIDVASVVGSIKANVGVVSLRAGAWDNHSPTTPSVAWSGMVAVLRGEEYEIIDGATEAKWIYWKAGETIFRTSAMAFPDLGNDDYLIAWNDGGVVATLWNNWLKSGVIAGDLLAVSNLITATAQIDDGIITNAKIASLDAGKITTGTLDAARLSAATLYITSTAQIADAIITGAKIQDASITSAKIQDAAITNAKIGSAAITTANIQDLQVTTLKIANNALTNKGESKGDGPTTIAAGAPQAVVGITMTTGGGSLVVLARVTVTSLGSGAIPTLRLRRNGNVLDTIVATGAGNFVLCALDSPSAGSNSYDIYCEEGLGSTNFVVEKYGVWATEYLK